MRMCLLAGSLLSVIVLGSCSHIGSGQERYQLQAYSLENPSSTRALVVKMDTETGRTWYSQYRRIGGMSGWDEIE